MVFDGDPKLYSTGDAFDLAIEAGQPDMDEGLENAVTMSLFSSGPYWGNVFARDEAERLGSDFEALFLRPLTSRTRLDAEAAVKAALAWMVGSGLAKAVSVEASLPSVGWLALAITLQQPAADTRIRYSINWEAMAVRLAGAFLPARDIPLVRTALDGGYYNSWYEDFIDCGAPDTLAFDPVYSGGDATGA